MLSAVIVNHRMAAFLPALVASLRAAGAEEIVVVDTPSTPDERERILALDGTRPLPLEENRGYGAALNAGVREARGDRLLLMNPDMEVPAGGLDPLLEALGRFHAVAPNTFWDRAQRWILPHPQPHTWRTDFTLRTRPEAALKQALAYQARLWGGTDPVEVPLLSGAAFVVRREAYEAVGGFDERYFLYFEENDFFERFRRAAFHAAVVPRARLFHFHEPGRHPAYAKWFHASRDLHERTWFPDLYLHGRSLLTTPAAAPAPALEWDSPIEPAGRTLLFSPFPILIPCTAAFGVEGTATPRELLAGIPVRGGFLALVEGSSVRARYSLGVK
ncbi:MAG TPA: hypothetical protein DCS11_07175 [Syntrophus sp. (in: bacteria)]|nr:hypothetical protein [Syntrophus sp. (in: bacteria)]